MDTEEKLEKLSLVVWQGEEGGLFFKNKSQIIQINSDNKFFKIQEMGNLDNYLTRFISSNVGN